MGTMLILNQTGDETLEWNAEDPQSVEAAKGRFTDLKGRGYRFYEAIAETVITKGKEVKEFSADLGRIVAAPATAPAAGSGPITF